MLVLAVLALAFDAPATSFEIGETDFLLDGKPFVLRCGEIHYARIPREYWRHRLQMLRAMGCNSVGCYMFWNFHERGPGKFVWEGRADAAAFCRMAQEEGLWVVLRPGPYACAEWEGGGAPWWLMANDREPGTGKAERGISMRSSDPRWVNPCKRWIAEVGRVLAPLQVSRGGPILMVQVENEYGLHGNDKDYIRTLRQATIDAGFEVPLYACNPPRVIQNGFVPELFQAANFGGDPEQRFGIVREWQPKGPLMCSEYYPAWFDTWGARHNPPKKDRDFFGPIDWMLAHRASFSLYMAHGGTSFGGWTGCRNPFVPNVTSYDYEAPINEHGAANPSFAKFRDRMARHLNPGETIPEPPAPVPVKAYGKIALEPVAPTSPAAKSGFAHPVYSENLGMGFGFAIWETVVPAGVSGDLRVENLHDFGYVSLDDRRIGVIDRRHRGAKTKVPASDRPQRLKIVVEAMGRINSSQGMEDRKGLDGRVFVGATELVDWSVALEPVDPDGQENPPGNFRGIFMVGEPADTFVDMRAFNKGVVWVNGHNLGRYWKIGPQQTLYLPGCWLKPGENKIVVREMFAPWAAPTVEFRDRPILDELHPEADFAGPRREAAVFPGGIVQASGTFPDADSAQVVMFPAPVSGDTFTLQAVSVYDRKGVASIAEFDFLDADGNPLTALDLQVLGADSEEEVVEDGAAENAIDGQLEVGWLTSSRTLPHWIAFRASRPVAIHGFRVTPRQARTTGRIREWKFFAKGGEGWPAVTREMRPWVYNWWMGSAVDEAGLRLQVEEMAKVGLGGMHVIPIYSAKDDPNDRELNSPGWQKAFAAAVRLAQERGLGVDLTTGSGWCFGGPQLAREDGAWMLEVDSKRLANSEVLWRGTNAQGRATTLSVRPTGQQVKRSGPGAHGPMMNPLSASAMRRFLEPFSAVYDRPDAARPGRMYHDSYEYYGAGWSRELPEAFARRRGYRLEDHYAELAGVGDPDSVARVKCDYRETLSETLVEDVFSQWQEWCRERGMRTRNEAHGAPANWLDFYALADIPETEMFGCDKPRAQFPSVRSGFLSSGDRDILISKFASSAAHVKHAGAPTDPLVSSETCTWLCEHFCETPAAVKTFVDRLLLAGVNHVFYHGMCYSPADARWPGRTFYATCEMNRFNPIWREADLLNAYVTRVQSIAQTTAIDNDVLVYWPLHDFWMDAEGFEKQLTVHARDWFGDQPVGRISRALYDAGFAFDFISEKQLMAFDPAGTSYTTLVVPQARVMKPALLKRIFALAGIGMDVRFVDGVPSTVPGLKEVASGEAELKRLLSAPPANASVSTLAEFLAGSRARKEPFCPAGGLMYTRHKKDGITWYFIANQLRDEGVKGTFRPSSATVRATVYDPWTGRIAPVQVRDGEVELELAVGESTILAVSGDTAPAAPAASAAVRRKVVALDGVWKRIPVAGGPEMPAPVSGRLPLPWGNADAFPESAFAGTMRYETSVEIPRCGDGLAVLSLGRVAESARLFVNGAEAGATILPPWKVSFDGALLKDGTNVIAVETTSSGANRLKWLDSAKPYPWKVFTDINMVDINYKSLDASGWPQHEYGLYGPVSLAFATK